MGRLTQFIYVLFALGGVLLILYGAVTVHLGWVLAVQAGAIAVCLFSRKRMARSPVGPLAKLR